jgi:Family of unknown function (DUF6130)
MSTIKMPEELNRNRSRFLRDAAMTLAAAELATMGSAKARSSKKVPAIRPGTNKSAARKIIIDPPLAEPRSHGGVAIQYRTENLHMVPVCGPAAKPQPEAHQRSEFSL